MGSRYAHSSQALPKYLQRINCIFTTKTKLDQPFGMTKCVFIVITNKSVLVIYMFPACVLLAGYCFLYDLLKRGVDVQMSVVKTLKNSFFKATASYMGVRSLQY